MSRGLLVLLAIVAAGAPVPGSPSLLDALPSPRPSVVLPSMPPPMVGTWLLREDFEHGMGRWHMTGGQGALGWHLLRAAACGGAYTMVLGLPHNAPFAGSRCKADLYLSKPLALARLRHPRLQYDLKGFTQPLELLTVQPWARRPGGAWRAVGVRGHARYEHVVTFTADLTPYAGGPLELRFHGQVNAAPNPNRGLYLDDVYVLEPRLERPRN